MDEVLADEQYNTMSYTQTIKKVAFRCFDSLR